MAIEDKVEEEFDIVETIHLCELKEGFAYIDLNVFEHWIHEEYDQVESVGLIDIMTNENPIAHHTMLYENKNQSLSIVFSRIIARAPDENIIYSNGHLLVSTADREAYEKFSDFMDLYAERIKRE
ncbi:hypothetical protein GOV10_03090 [Candidatus Woesearchaeota archaeon]|nr:hypothetical protein [Candidatus Woesearchaeota archaeon]